MHFWASQRKLRGTRPKGSDDREKLVERRVSSSRLIRSVETVVSGNLGESVAVDNVAGAVRRGKEEARGRIEEQASSTWTTNGNNLCVPRHGVDHCPSPSVSSPRLERAVRWQKEQDGRGSEPIARAAAKGQGGPSPFARQTI